MLLTYSSVILNTLHLMYVVNFSGTLEGERQRPSYNELIDDPLLNFSGACEENCSDLYVTCRIFADGHPLALPVCTAYKSFSSRWK